MSATRILVVILLAVLADQLTKMVALSALSLGNPVTVLPGVNPVSYTHLTLPTKRIV